MEEIYSTNAHPEVKVGDVLVVKETTERGFLIIEKKEE